MKYLHCLYRSIYLSVQLVIELLDPFYEVPTPQRLNSVQEQGQVKSYGAEMSSIKLYFLPSSDKHTALLKKIFLPLHSHLQVKSTTFIYYIH